MPASAGSIPISALSGTTAPSRIRCSAVPACGRRCAPTGCCPRVWTVCGTGRPRPARPLPRATSRCISAIMAATGPVMLIPIRHTPCCWRCCGRGLRPGTLPNAGSVCSRIWRLFMPRRSTRWETLLPSAGSSTGRLPGRWYRPSRRLSRPGAGWTPVLRLRSARSSACRPAAPPFPARHPRRRSMPIRACWMCRQHAPIPARILSDTPVPIPFSLTRRVPRRFSCVTFLSTRTCWAGFSGILRLPWERGAPTMSSSIIICLSPA